MLKGSKVSPIFTITTAEAVWISGGKALQLRALKLSNVECRISSHSSFSQTSYMSGLIRKTRKKLICLGWLVVLMRLINCKYIECKLRWFKWKIKHKLEWPGIKFFSGFPDGLHCDAFVTHFRFRRLCSETGNETVCSWSSSFSPIIVFGSCCGIVGSYFQPLTYSNDSRGSYVVRIWHYLVMFELC